MSSSFLSTANPSSAMKFYMNVMDDVLAGVREAFLDDGVDEQVLQELRQMWEAKIQASKVIDPPEIVEPQPPPLQITQPPQNDNKNANQAKQTNGVPVSSTPSSRAKPAVVTNVPVPTTPSTVATSVTTPTPNLPVVQQLPSQLSQPPQVPQTVSQPVVNNVQDKLVPIQLTLPAPAGSQDNQSRIYNIQVPASALATDQLQRILTAQVISATMALPPNVASTLLQQHVTAALQSQANQTQTNANSNISSSSQMNGVQGVSLTENSSSRQFPIVNQIPGNITQIDGTWDDDLDPSDSPSLSDCVPEKGASNSMKDIKIVQLDGIYDTSSDDEDDDDDDDLEEEDDDDDDDENDEKEEDNDEAENGVEEDPLNSGDDVSEGDNTDLFETENVVVCQYDKINRSRNKWKFYLKDGIMNLAGRDYIFQKANGDAEW